MPRNPRKRYIPLVVAGVLLATVWGLVEVARGQETVLPGRPQAPGSEVQGENRREVQAPAGHDGAVPLISFIDSPTATCYQPDPTQDVCRVNWYYMAVDASPNYMVAMTTTLNAIGPVARYHGFFQTSMYVPYSMSGNGFQVSCGALGAGGHPALGNAYAWTINARDSSNLKSANYGTVYCPAFVP